MRKDLANQGDDGFGLLKGDAMAMRSVLSRGVQAFALASVASSVLLVPVEARTTRTFSGSNPAEVEKNARRAGFDYPDGEMKCSSRCNQRWAKE